MESPEDYLKSLEKPGAVEPEAEDPLECLTIVFNFLELAREEVLDKGAIKHLREERAPHSALAERLLVPRLRSPDKKLVCEVARALATFRVAAAFAGLEQCPADVYTALGYGVLGDVRAERKLLEWFDEADKKHKRNAALAFTVKLNILNALVAIDGPGSKKLVERLAQDKRSKLARFAQIARSDSPR